MKKLLLIIHLLGGLLATAKDRPSILWITSEDNSPHWLGCYGNNHAKTPHIDALATEGVLFNFAYSNAPVCAVARSTILMGMHAPSMGTQHMRSRHAIPANWRPHVEFLRNHGYYATNNSKTDYNIEGDDRAHWDASSNQAHYRNRPDGQPFFAIFNLHESHESSLFDDKPVNPRRLTPDQVTLPPYLPDLPEIRNDIARYHDRIEDMDARVGRILADLEKTGLAEDTIVFYYSDHGGVLPRDKRYLEETGVKVPLIVRIPGKFRHLAPFPPGQRVDELVEFADLAPTLLSLAGVDVPASMQGRPFLGAQRSAPPADHMVFLYADRFDELYRMRRGLTDGTWKYIRNFTPHLPLAPYSFYQFRQPCWVAYRDAWKSGKLDGYHQAQWEPPTISEQLYDLEADPWETRNLAADPDHAERLAAFRTRLKSTMIELHDTGLVPEPMFANLAGGSTIADHVRSEGFPMGELTALAFLASENDPKNLPSLKQALTSDHPAARYWAALGIRILAEHATSSSAALTPMLQDEHPVIRTTAAEALHAIGEKETATNHLLADAASPMDELSMLHLLNTLYQLDMIEKIPKKLADKLTARTGYIRRLMEHRQSP